MAHPRGKGVGCDKPRIQGSMSIDREVWKEAGRLARRKGISRSRMIEDWLRGQIDSPALAVVVPAAKPVRPVSKRQQKRAARKEMASAAIVVEKVVEVVPEPKASTFDDMCDAIPKAHRLSIEEADLVISPLIRTLQPILDLGYRMIALSETTVPMIDFKAGADTSVNFLLTIPMNAFFPEQEIDGFRKKYPDVFANPETEAYALGVALQLMGGYAAWNKVQDDSDDVLCRESINRSLLYTREEASSLKEYQAVVTRQVLTIEMAIAVRDPEYLRPWLVDQFERLSKEAAEDRAKTTKKKGFGGDRNA